MVPLGVDVSHHKSSKFSRTLRTLKDPQRCHSTVFSAIEGNGCLSPTGCGLHVKQHVLFICIYIYIYIYIFVVSYRDSLAGDGTGSRVACTACRRVYGRVRSAVFVLVQGGS